MNRASGQRPWATLATLVTALLLCACDARAQQLVYTGEGADCTPPPPISTHPQVPTPPSNLF